MTSLLVCVGRLNKNSEEWEKWTAIKNDPQQSLPVTFDPVNSQMPNVLEKIIIELAGVVNVIKL